MAQKIQEGIIQTLLALAGAFSLAVTVSIIGILSSESIKFFRRDEVSLVQFFFSTHWNPLLGAEKQFGIWPLVAGTFLVTAVAMALALPLGLITAIYLSEFASPRLRSFLKPALEILAGIPTVVYGFFALTVLTPALKSLDPSFNIYNAFAAGVAVGILCLPIVASLCEDALTSVPSALRDGALGLGATPFDAAVKVVVPAALSGIVAAFLLAISRAIGETMIVALAAGNTPKMTLDVRQEIQTMTGFMVQMALGDVSNFGIEYLSMYAVAITLFVVTFLLTLGGQVIRRRYREAYQ
jgi:phosphate transport system permease protein